MSTKAEEHRYWTERSGPKKPKAAPRTRRASAVDTSKPGVSASDRRAAPRESAAAAKKAPYALERTAGRPSRKSTRKAANRQRNDAQMRVKARTTESRPRAGRTGR